ncbi:MAG: glycosyltransferase family 1 protein [Candidatus Sumerlaeota bacterium]
MASAQIVTNKTHVVIDARTIRAKRTGVGNGAYRQLIGVERLLAAGETERFTMTAIRFAPDLADDEFRTRWDSFKNIKIVDTAADYTAHPSGDWWLERTLPKLLEKMAADILYSPAFIGPCRGKFKKVLMIHDDLVWSQPASYPLKFRTYMKTMITRSAKASDRVLYPSQDARQRCDALLNSPPERSAVLRHGIDASQLTATPLSAREKFVLCIASGERRKNHEVLIRALANQRELKLILIGVTDEDRVKELKSLMTNQNVEFIASANEATIRSYLQRAAVLALPTRGEGFGLPVLEAMACGTPVVLSDIPVMHEVAGDAALYIQPDDVGGWRKALLSAASHTVEVESRVDIGLKRLPQFMLEQNAKQLLAYFTLRS